jgi:hypothetical protein
MATKHQDVIRIIASSNKSFEDAVQTGIQELVSGPHHKDLRFSRFLVVLVGGMIDEDNQGNATITYEVVLDVTGEHVVEMVPV